MLLAAQNAVVEAELLKQGHKDEVAYVHEVVK